MARLHRTVLSLALLVSAALSRALAASDAVDARPEAPLERRIIVATVDPAHPVALKVTLLTPPGPGPFPLAIWNHGSNGIGPKQQMADYDNHMGTYYFLSRGYAVALPLLRGYGGSGGHLVAAGCDLAELGRGDAKDIVAVLDQVARDQAIDTRRVIVAGGSFGGWNALAVGTLHDPRVKAIVNFYGGLRSSACRNGDNALRQGAQTFGRESRVPSIWFYGDNDRFFSKPLWQAMHRDYVGEGGRADLVDFGVFKTDSHRLLSYPEAVPIFAGKLDAFLSHLGLPATNTHPDYLPMIPPSASNYAQVQDVAAVPFLNEPGRELYRKFLGEPLPRAFVIAPLKGAFADYGGYDPLARGLSTCRRRENDDCRLYAVNNDVVWTYPTPVPPATDFAALEDVSAIPYIDQTGRDSFRRFLASPRPRAFVIAPDGGWSLASLSPDPVAAALGSCARSHGGCRVYAVDGNVVWPEKPAATH